MAKQYCNTKNTIYKMALITRTMRRSLILLVSFFSVCLLSAQNTKTLTGRVISEELDILPQGKVYDKDTTVLGVTDSEGYFKINVPAETNELLFKYISMEWTQVRFENDCSNLEIIIMLDGNYDFISARSERRKRYKRFKRLPEKHLEAYGQGLFKSEKPCLCYVFRE